MAANDALDRGEPDAGSLELLGGVQALKHSEELARIGHVEAGAVVAHEIGNAAI